MSFVPEKFPENPRMAPEKYGMYVFALFIFMKDDKAIDLIQW